MKFWMSLHRLEPVTKWENDVEVDTGRAFVTVEMDALEANKFIGMLGSKKDPKKLSVSEIKSASVKKTEK